MRILLTGACGYVGSRLYPRLKTAGHEVIGVDLKWFAENLEVLKADVRTLHLDASPFDAWRPEVIIHLAAISNDPSVSYYPRRSWETGVLATQQLCQWAARNDCRFIYASSVSVYGADRGHVTEGMDLSPLSDYNKTKMCAERIVLSYPRVTPQIIRPATICGLSPRMRLDLTVNMFVVQALKNGVMTVHGGQQWRPSIHIDDMCSLYLWMIDHPEHTGIWNAGFENFRLIQIAQRIKAATGAEIQIENIHDARSYQVDSSKLLDVGFVPTKNIDDAIRELLNAWTDKTLTDDERWNNLRWMRRQRIADE